MNIIFFGTPKFSEIILEYLVSNSMVPIAVVTQPDKPVGRKHELLPSRVTQFATDHGISVLQPEKLNSEEFLSVLRDYTPDIFVIASFGRILHEALLDIPPKRTINVHPSLLPKYRGPTPIQTAILNGDTETGVTLMLTDAKMDHGPILANSKWQIATGIGYNELHDQLAKLGGELLLENLPKWMKGEITPQEQDHSKATFTKILTKEDGKIDWTKSAEGIDRQIRAFEEWPGTYTFWSRKTSSLWDKQLRLKILAGHVSNESTSEKPGTIIKTKNDALGVACGNGVYELNQVQPESKKVMSGKAFLTGYSAQNSFFG